MKNRKGMLPLIIGSALILAGLCLFLIFQFRGHRGDKQMEAVASQINTLLPERSQGVPGLATDSRMPVLEIDGQDYAALVEIPAFDLALPVADRWDSQKLTAGPVRFHGSAYDGSLVIGGVDREGHFAFCSQIDLGATVTVTDMTGAQFTYTVSRIDRSDTATSDWLISPDHGLTLYCRDATSLQYVAVRCTFA